MQIFVVEELFFHLAIFGGVIIASLRRDSLGARSLLMGIILVYLLFIAQRDRTYNLDTRFYDGMFIDWNFTILRSWVVKLEPVHYILRNISVSFNMWLVAENMMIFVMIAYLMRRFGMVTNTMILVLCLPLVSSSFRLVTAILIIAVLLSTRLATWLKYAVPLLFHTVGVFVPFVMRPVFIFALPALVLSLMAVSPAVSERLQGALELGGFKPVGGKIIVTAVLYFLIARFLLGVRRMQSGRHLFFLVVLSVMGALLFPMFNRFMLLYLIGVVCATDAVLAQKRFRWLNSAVSCGALFLVFDLLPLFALIGGLSDNIDWQLGYNNRVFR